MRAFSAPNADPLSSHVAPQWGGSLVLWSHGGHMMVKWLSCSGHMTHVIATWMSYEGHVAVM